MLYAGTLSLSVSRSRPLGWGARAAGDLLMVLCVTMAAAVLSASFAVFLVREAESRSKHVQVHICIVFADRICREHGCSPRLRGVFAAATA